MRILNRLLSVILGLVIAGAAAVAGIEAVLLVAGQPSLVVPRARWAHYLAGASWTSTWIQIPAITLLAVGAVIGLLQLIPRRPVRLAARSTARREVWVSRRGLGRRLAADVARLDSVREARTKVTRRAVKSRVTSAPGTSVPEVRLQVDRAVETTVAQLGVTTRLRPKTKVRVNEVRVQ
jgi:Family of unknown function (DUF6286)